MVCPGCKSIIPQVDSEAIEEKADKKTYQHECSRCWCLITVEITINRRGNPDLIQKYQGWLNGK